MAAKAGFSTASTATLRTQHEDQPVGVLAQRQPEHEQREDHHRDQVQREVDPHPPLPPESAREERGKLLRQCMLPDDAPRRDEMREVLEVTAGDVDRLVEVDVRGSRTSRASLATGIWYCRCERGEAVADDLLVERQLEQHDVDAALPGLRQQLLEHLQVGDAVLSRRPACGSCSTWSRAASSGCRSAASSPSSGAARTRCSADRPRAGLRRACASSR